MIEFGLDDSKLFFNIKNFEEIKPDEYKILKDNLYVLTENYRFHPLYKKGLWNGKINFLMNGTKIPFGLYNEVKKMLNSHGIECKIHGLGNVVDPDFDTDELEKWCDEFYSKHNSKIKLRYYQIEAVAKILKTRRCILELATSAGKTLIIFTAIAYMLEKEIANKFLIIVPRITLVEQIQSEFINYLDDKDLDKYNISLLFGGRKDIDTSKHNIFIGTYQTLTKISKDFFENIDCICCDEVHTASTKSIQNICSMLVNCHIRFGLSGTTKVTNHSHLAGKYTILSNFGPLVMKVSSYKLSNEGFICKVNVKVKVLDYLQSDMKEKLSNFKKGTSQDNLAKVFNLEKKIARDSQKRSDYIVKTLMKDINTNTLLLFQSVSDKYGEMIANSLRINYPDKNIYYISGDTNIKERNEIIEKISTDTKTSFLVASYQILSTGVNIQNLHNLVMLESTKSETTVLQSLGRIMRLHKSKSDRQVTVYDLVDDFRFKKSYNFLFKHHKERLKLYDQENIDYEIENIIL